MNQNTTPLERLEGVQTNAFTQTPEEISFIGYPLIRTYLRPLEERLDVAKVDEEQIKHDMATVLEELDGKKITFINTPRKYETALFIARFIPSYMDFKIMSRQDAFDVLLDMQQSRDRQFQNRDEQTIKSTIDAQEYIVRLYDKIYQEKPFLKKVQASQKKDVDAISSNVSGILYRGDPEKGPDPQKCFDLMKIKIVKNEK